MHKYVRLLLFKVIPIVVAIPLFLTIAYKIVPPVSTLMVFNFVTGKGVEREWLPLKDMSENLQHAVLMSEDGKFCKHNGVDWTEFGKQLTNFNRGNPTRGASTITMQLAKNLFLWHGRSYLRKVLELPLALWIDLVLGKKRSLEIYLNIVEWDEGVFGANAATIQYFGKTAESLSRKKAALMATALPNPIDRNPSRPTSSMNKNANKIVSRMKYAGDYVGCISE